MTVRELWGPDHAALLARGRRLLRRRARRRMGARAWAIRPSSRSSRPRPSAAFDREEIERQRSAARSRRRSTPTASACRSSGRTACSTSRARSRACFPLCAAGATAPREANAQHGGARAARARGRRRAGGRGDATGALLGLVGIADPPRTEAIEAVAAARERGHPHRDDHRRPSRHGRARSRASSASCRGRGGCRGARPRARHARGQARDRPRAGRRGARSWR